MRITDTADLWWKNAVVYCLDVETYMDWNADGIGDFAGLAQRIDHLADLGVHTARLAEYAELGFDKIMLHHVGQEQEAFVAAFGEKVLPQLRSISGGTAA